MKTKHKRCWSCGKRFYGGRGIVRIVDGHPRDLHKWCARQIEADEARENNAFGMEF